MEQIGSERIVLDIPAAFTAEELAHLCRVKEDSAAFGVVEESLDAVNEYAAPKAVLKWATVDGVQGDLTTVDGAVFQSKVVADKLKDTPRVFLSVITAGSGLEACGEFDGDPFLDTLNGALLAHATGYTVRYMKEHWAFYIFILPALVDVDTGGNPLNLIRLVRDFERIGVAAIQLEDQAAPKRCGHEQGRRVVSAEEMCLRIRAVLDARSGPEGLVLVARTDARTSLGVDEAIRRANLYLEAGADLIFVESPESEAEVARICREVAGPILYNNVEGGRSPFLSRERLQECGVRAVIYPNTLTRIMVPAARRLLSVLMEQGTTEPLWPEMITHRDLWPLFGSEEWLELERKYRP